MLAAGSALGYIDLLLIGGVYLQLNKKIDSISPSSSLAIGSAGKTSGPSGSNGLEGQVKNKLQDRILRLETDNEVLLQRMQCYDKLFEQILCFIKENKSHMEIPVQVERQVECSPSRKTSLRPRRIDSVLTRKECFVDDEGEAQGEAPSEAQGETQAPAEENIASEEDEMFSFLQ